jgi:hypothetical protein
MSNALTKSEEKQLEAEIPAAVLSIRGAGGDASAVKAAVHETFERVVTIPRRVREVFSRIPAGQRRNLPLARRLLVPMRTRARRFIEQAVAERGEDARAEALAVVKDLIPRASEEDAEDLRAFLLEAAPAAPLQQIVNVTLGPGAIVVQLPQVKKTITFKDHEGKETSTAEIVSELKA